MGKLRMFSDNVTGLYGSRDEASGRQRSHIDNKTVFHVAF